MAAQEAQALVCMMVVLVLLTQVVKALAAVDQAGRTALVGTVLPMEMATVTAVVVVVPVVGLLAV
jgi:hypothetical protein